MDQVEEKEHKEPEILHSEHGRAVFEWIVPKYFKYARSRAWYITAGVVAAALLIYAFKTSNLLFAIIIVMLAINIMVLNTLGEPGEMRFALTERGVVWGANYYPYIEVSNFWIVYQPPAVKNIYLEFKSFAKPRIQVPLGDQNPIAVREFLKKFVREDATRNDEPGSDYLGRVLKI